MSNDTTTPTINDVLTLEDGRKYKVVSVRGSRILADPVDADEKSGE